MFRKLVSNLPYSPALIADVGFYAKRLRQEDVTRRTTILFVVLAMVIQSLAVFSPPESANASSEQDIIRGGVSSLEDFLLRYDHNEDDIRDIYKTAGISRGEIAAAKPGTISSDDNIYVMSRYGYLSSSKNEVSMPYLKSTGGTGIRYFSPITSVSDPGVRFNGWIGNSATLGWFAIIQSNGSLATKGTPASINPVNLPNGTPMRSISVRNLTNPGATTAKSHDKLSYTLQQSNKGMVSMDTTFTIRLADVLEYASLIDNGGGNFNETTDTLTWQDAQLAPGESQQRTFVVQILSDVPATGVGKSNPASFDCTLTLAFGVISETPVECPLVKVAEGIFSLLPSAGAGINIGFAIALFAIVAFFYIRTRQLRKEIKVIRHNFNAGII